MTNGDKIRAMADEELAVLANTHLSCPLPYKSNCPHIWEIINCKDCWVEWMKQEVSDNG